MAEKRFAGLQGAVESAKLSADFEAAESFDKLRVGRLGVYYRDGFKTKYIDYAGMERAFIRIQEVNGRMCCGRATFAYYRMVFVCGGREIADFMSEKEAEMDAALAKIHAMAPDVLIGVAPKEEQQV